MGDVISLGLWIKRRRKALDLTQAELAQRVGCSLDLIQKIESDARRPSRDMAARLAEMLELAADERAPFIQAARAELGADRLAPPTKSVTRGAFVPAPAAESQAVPTAAPAPPLPSGTVTFLFTDIEGSTRLWERYPQAMPAVIERHNALLYQIVTVHSGVIFKMVGDSILAAFADAPSALAAALAAQRALHAEAWGAVGALRVRMALHTGSAEARDGDYLGPTLNRAARLLGAGHGGQILLALATAQLVREHLPPDAALRDLGTHRLKDVSMPEQIFQLVVPDLPATFPVLNTLDVRRTNLSAQPTALIGRERELAQVGALLQQPDARLVTLTGPGGIGKTRLGLQVAEALIDGFPDGVYFVDLAPIREPSLVISAIAQTLEIRETGGQPLITQLQLFLSDKRMLLLLDNFEQVLDAAPLLADLLSTTSRVTLLVTSRERLHLRGEKEMAVPPLAVPPSDDGRGTRDDKRQGDVVSGQWSVVTDYAAVQLFIQRARDAQPDFQISSANVEAVAEICARLDGLPLAIELAAARVKLFAPEALLARLSSRLALLTGGARDLPLRQQTIRNTIAWSYDLLTADEQALFARLGVFVGGCTLEAAEAVCGSWGLGVGGWGSEAATPTPISQPPTPMLDGLAALVDKSLVRQVVETSGDTRFVMLETIRAYALERLEASGEAGAVRQHHAGYYLALSETEPSDQARWLRRNEPEYDNLSSALDWSLTLAGDPEVGLRLASGLRWLWYRSGIHEAITMFERALNHARGVGRTVAHAEARFWLAGFLGSTNDYAAARIQFEQALSLWRELGDMTRYAATLERLGWLAREQGDSAAAWPPYNESLAIFRAHDNAAAIAGTLMSMAGVAILEEDPARAEALLAESRALAQHAAVDSDRHIWTLNHLGHAAQLRGDFDRAAQLHHECLRLVYQMPGTPGANLIATYQGLGETALGLGRLDEAADWLRQGLALSQTTSDQLIMSYCLAGLGSAAALDEEPERGARLWGAAERLRQAIGGRPAPAARATYERAIAAARAQLGEEAFAAAWAAGAALTLEQAIAEALEPR